MVGSPEFMSFQLAPASVLLDTPPLVSAYIVFGFCGSIMNAKTYPKFSSALQLAPPSVLLNNPFPFHAYTVLVFCGSIAKPFTPPPFGFESNLVQLAPPAMLFHTPPVRLPEQGI